MGLTDRYEGDPPAPLLYTYGPIKGPVREACSSKKDQTHYLYIYIMMSNSRLLLHYFTHHFQHQLYNPTIMSLISILKVKCSNLHSMDFFYPLIRTNDQKHIFHSSQVLKTKIKASQQNLGTNVICCFISSVKWHKEEISSYY